MCHFLGGKPKPLDYQPQPGDDLVMGGNCTCDSQFLNMLAETFIEALPAIANVCLSLNQILGSLLTCSVRLDWMHDSHGCSWSSGRNWVSSNTRGWRGHRWRHEYALPPKQKMGTVRRHGLVLIRSSCRHSGRQTSRLHLRRSIRRGRRIQQLAQPLWHRGSS